MNGIRFGENVKILPILTIGDIVATATGTAYVDLDGVNWASFLVTFGTVASTDSTGEVAITVEASTAGSSNATEGAITFHYRLSAAVATDTMGAITAATVAGAAINNTADNTVVIIDVDPSVVAASAADRRFVRLMITPTAEVTATNVSVIAILDTRHKSKSIPSST
jgi:hypothetical protein